MTEELREALEELRPLLNGSAGTFLGIYTDAAARVCEEMNWEHEHSIEERND